MQDNQAQNQYGSTAQHAPRFGIQDMRPSLSDRRSASSIASNVTQIQAANAAVMAANEPYQTPQQQASSGYQAKLEELAEAERAIADQRAQIEEYRARFEHHEERLDELRGSRGAPSRRGHGLSRAHPIEAEEKAEDPGMALQRPSFKLNGTRTR